MKHPAIAEKVKFWEEQQRINGLLIPRIAESIKITRELSDGLESLRGSATEAESRFREQVRSVQKPIHQLKEEVSSLKRSYAQQRQAGANMETSLRKGLGLVEDELGAVKQELESLVLTASEHGKEIERSVEAIGKRVDTLGEAANAALVARRLAMLALGVGGIAFVLALIGMVV